MSYGIVCEHDGCKAFAKFRRASPVRFYCADHGPDEALLAEIQHSDHERYGDNDGMRRALERRAIGTRRPPSAMLVAMLAATAGATASVHEEPPLQRGGRRTGHSYYYPTPPRPYVATYSERDRSALDKATEKRARKAAKLAKQLGGG